MTDPGTKRIFPMKVLIVTLDNVGDTIITLAIHNALRGNTAFTAGYWTKDYSRAVVPLAGGDIEHYHCDPFWDRSPGAGKGGKLAFLRTLLKIRRARFDAALIVHSNWRKNLACLLAGIPRRYVLKGAFGTDYVAPAGSHVLDSCRALLKALTGKDPGELTYPLSPASYGEAPAVAQTFSQGRWAVVHPFSGNPSRNLPLAAWSDIMDFLAAQDLRVLVNASPAEKELFAPARGAYAARPGDLLFSCDLDLDITNLAYALSRAALFIGNNSGPLHLASAVGTPSVGIFQESWIARIAPRGKFFPLLAVFKDSPSELSAAGIIEKARGLLAATPAAPRRPV